MEKPSVTRGQLERTLSQSIQALYRNELGHQPSKITCQIFDSKIAIILENSLTKPEQLLAENGKEDLAEQVRSDLEEVIQPQIKALIEEIVGISVIDLLSDSKLDTGRSGTIAVLADSPALRNL
ncbi:Protein of unknown function DUF2294 [Crinalium epipsammum PCC 9333]|uniref:Na+-translocating membrane potential-generating system MpsC domain-containing protein n=1 Tax=Crinalium epipsammum PCC 9333 TaxID=1173022 RepID=K9W164_9CYAN|nr:DUF2294 domain-containing protein [Crinalium epipsammum]AFZ13961.1 Protein of unknown function DUF2294 [Crinalium epipsammum PCC 9333]